MVDEILAETGTVQTRFRDLPSLVVVYLLLRVLALVGCGPRTVLDAVFGPTPSGETTYTPQLLRSLRPGMIVLLDRNFAAQTLLNAIAGTHAKILVRVKNGRKLPVLARYTDGSYLSTLGTLLGQIIRC